MISEAISQLTPKAPIDELSKGHLPKVAVNGFGGFAWMHRRFASRAEADGLCQFAGLAAYEKQAAAAEETEAGSLWVVENLREILQRLDSSSSIVTSPSPIHFHASDHRMILESGNLCYLEKPPILDPLEMRRMIAIDKKARRPTGVGFQEMAHAGRLALKSRLVAGEFGKLQLVSFYGLWRRDHDYYKRNDWAGSLMAGDTLVLDSVFGNAMAHYFHASLFWAGVGELWNWAKPATVKASLYRANPIEGADTVFAEAVTERGIKLRFAASHACREECEMREHIQCEDAVISFSSEDAVRISWRDGRLESIPFDGADLHYESFAHYLRCTTGAEPQGRYVELRDCESYVDLSALFYLASGAIHTIEAKYFEEDPDSFMVDGLAVHTAAFIDHGIWPHQGEAAWAVQPGEAAPAQLPLLRSTIERMVAANQILAAI